MSILKEVASTIIFPPILVQTALDGIWEEAWKIKYPEGAPSEDEIRRHIPSSSQDIAFEIFFKTKEGDNIFFGVRKEGIDLSAAFSAIWNAENNSFEAMVSNLSRKITGRENSFLDENPASLVLGVVDWWKTFGECQIWQEGEAKFLTEAGLVDKLSSNKALLRNSNNYAAMEVAYNKTEKHPQHWIGMQVSRRTGDDYLLDTNRVLYLVESVLN